MHQSHAALSTTHARARAYAQAHACARGARERRSKCGKYANIKETSIVIIMKNEI